MHNKYKDFVACFRQMCLIAFVDFKLLTKLFQIKHLFDYGADKILVL